MPFGEVFMTRSACLRRGRHLSPQHVESNLRGPELDHLARTAELMTCVFDSAMTCHRDVNSADGLCFTSAGRTGDPGDADAVRCGEAPPGTIGHLSRHLLRNFPVLVDD